MATMVASQHVLDTLKQIGLNLYERKLWVALLSRGTASAGELSELAKIPRSRSYDVLETLADKGFVMVKNAKPLQYVAIPPAEALERAKKKVKEDADVSAKQIETLKSSQTLKDLEKIFKDGLELVEPGDLAGSLKGSHQVHDQMGTVFKSAKSRISIVSSVQALKDMHAKHADALKKASSKGVRIKIAVHGKAEPEFLKEMESFAEVKQISEPLGRFAVIDGKHVILGLTGDETHPTQETAFWAQSDQAAKVFEPMFQHIWEHMD